MRQAGDRFVSMQPSCSYDTACSEQIQRPPHGQERLLRSPQQTRIALHCSARRQNGLLNRRWPLAILIVMLVSTLLEPSAAFTLAGDAQDRAFEDVSMLARAGKLLNVAVSDAAKAIAATKTRRSATVEKRTLLMPEKQVRSRSYELSCTEVHVASLLASGAHPSFVSHRESH